MNIILAILVTGLSGITAQVLLLRELLVSFHGNELTVGIMLANWVMLEALGVFTIGKYVDRLKSREGLFILLQIIFSLSFIAAIYLARTFKGMLGINFGESLGLDMIFLASFLTMLFPAFSHGALFSLSCAIGSNIGRVYAWETIGTIIGAVATTYLFIPLFHSFQIAVLLLILSSIASLGLLWRMRSIRLRYLWLLFIILALGLFLSGKIGYLQRLSIAGQWKGVKVLGYRNSAYGNIVAAAKEKQTTFFYNGIPLITTPYPDITFVQELGNLPLLFHPGPQDILIATAGAGGLINEILKYPVKRIDYVELDPELIAMLKRYPSGLTEKELGDPRVNVKNEDARFFVKNTTKQYDLILIGLSNPADLATNRFFTQEFFVLAKGKLRPEGILAFWLPGSLTYLGIELRDLNACILNGLKASYAYLRIIPGDYNICLASDSEQIMQVSPALIQERLAKYSVNPGILLPTYLDYRLDKNRVEWFQGSLKDATRKVNQDSSPYAVFAMLLFWNKQFLPNLTKYMQALGRLDLKIIIALVILLTFLIYPKAKEKKFSLTYCIVTTGFFGMLLNLVLIFSFQVSYGYLYHKIGLLISIFMAGIALGSLFITQRINKLKNKLRLFMGLEIAVILYSFLVAFISLSGWQMYLGYLVLFFICGLLMGLEFPLASALYLEAGGKIGSSAGSLYAADLLGGWLAGILGGVVLLPVLGLFESCMVAVLLKLSSFILLWAFARK
jgi:spermidine synthase